MAITVTHAAGAALVRPGQMTMDQIISSPWQSKTIRSIQLWPFISYNWLFLWDYTFYKWAFLFVLFFTGFSLGP